jgi:putative chitinase
MSLPVRLTFNDKAFFDGYRRKFGKLSGLQVLGLNELLRHLLHDPEIIGDLWWASYLLATAKHETAHTFRPIAEIPGKGGVTYFERYDHHTRKGRELGNTTDGDGFRYRGRGYVQLTGRANYRKMATRIDVDFEAHPDMVMESAYAYRVMSVGMRVGAFTGKRLADYRFNTRLGRVLARRIINGLDRAATIAGYCEAFHEILEDAVTYIVPPQEPAAAPQSAPSA